MTEKNKDMLLCSLIGLLVLVLIIIGGINQRGYYAPASEIVAVPALVLWVIERRSKWLTR